MSEGTVADPAQGVEEPNSSADKDGEEVLATSIRALLFRGFSWTFVENIFGQGLRFVSNLILTYLLLPEYFGLMALVNLFIQGLEMISDVGIGLSVVQDKRGSDPKFLNTAWSIQVLRGLIMYVAALALMHPVARFYCKPELLQLLPVAALGVVINGASSINFHLLARRVALGRIAVLNIGSQMVAMAVTILLAWLLRSVWALVIGSLSGNAVKCALTFVMCPGPRNRFAWNAEAAHAIVRFGMWIFVSSLLGFVTSKLDLLGLGAYMTTAVFGVYTIANNLAQAGIGVLNSVASRVLFPIYARLAEKGAGPLRQKTFRVRAVLILLSVPAYCILAVFGAHIVELIYPPKFAEAGWMLRVLSFGAIGSAVSYTIGPVLLALGDSFRYMIVLVSKTVILFASMLIGNYVYGTTGAIVGFALSDYLVYPILALMVRKYGVWLPALDFAGFAFGILCTALGYYLVP